MAISNIVDESDSSSPSLSNIREILTPREIEVCKMWFSPSGLSREEIAQSLHISLDTVKAHLRSSYSKLNVNEKCQALFAFYWAYPEHFPVSPRTLRAA